MVNLGKEYNIKVTIIIVLFNFFCWFENFKQKIGGWEMWLSNPYIKNVLRV